MTLTLYQLPPERVHQAWPQIAPLLDTLTQYCNGENTAEQTKVALISGATVALVIVDETMAIQSVIAGEWKMTPGKRIFFVDGWAGSNMPDELYTDMERWVKLNGGTAMQCAIRDSMGRMLQKRWNYKKVYTIYEKEIK